MHCLTRERLVGCLWILVAVLGACGHGSAGTGGASGAGAAGVGGAGAGPGGASPLSTQGTTNEGSGPGGSGSSGSTSSGSTTGTTPAGDGGVILYGSAHENVNMWLGPVTYVPGITNACASEPTELYPQAIQKLYGTYIIGLDGDNVQPAASHCDDCAQLTANGKTIIARVVTYGKENGAFALDLSADARTALGLSGSNWTGTWQFSSCPTGTSPIYYEFDARQWNPQNFWYMRIWTRNQHIPVQGVETNVANGRWAAAKQTQDGAWETGSGIDFSKGFQIRVTSNDGQHLVDTVPALAGIDPSTAIAGKANFR